MIEVRFVPFRCVTFHLRRLTQIVDFLIETPVVVTFLGYTEPESALAGNKNN